MIHAEGDMTQTEIDSFVTALDFVREYAIRIVSVAPGEVTIELPFAKRFSGPPGQFPASIVGTAGDVAAVTSCLSLLPRGWALATLDFTVKMTGVAKGEKLRARGGVLQAGRTTPSAPPTSMSSRTAVRRCAGQCLPPRVTSRSSRPRRRRRESFGVPRESAGA